MKAQATDFLSLFIPIAMYWSGLRGQLPAAADARARARVLARRRLRVHVPRPRVSVRWRRVRAAVGEGREHAEGGGLLPAVPARGDARAVHGHPAHGAHDEQADPAVLQRALEARRVPALEHAHCGPERPGRKPAAARRAPPALKLRGVQAQRRGVCAAGERGFLVSPLWCPWVECSARVPAVQNTKQKQNSRKTHAQHARAESGICSFGAAARSWGASLQQATVALERAWQCHGGLSEMTRVLEDELRHGNTHARAPLAALIPCAALRARYTMRTCPRARLCIEMCPDISCELGRAMLKFCPREDSFVTFLRACIPTLNNYKKIHREISWPAEQSATLRRLLCCCLPTLLALYPGAGSKDVGTPVRVALFWELRALAMATHTERVAFFSRHKVVLRLCLVEYTFYFLRTMPVHAYFVRNNKAHFLSIEAASMNMGRNFRVELNTQLQGARAPHVPWDALSATAKILYDRYVRLSKSVLSEPRGNANERAVVRAAAARRGLLGSAYQRHHEVLGDIPNTASFQVAEMFFRRAGVHVNEIAMLWEGLYSVRLQELPACVLRAQLSALFRTCGGSERLMHKYSNVLLCRFCLLQGVATSFRFDSLRGTYTCNRCELYRSVVNVCMLGRIAWVRNIPLVLCTQCCKVVVYSGAGHELLAHTTVPTTMPALACAQSHIYWQENINLNSLSALVQNCGFMQFLLANVVRSPRPWPYIEFNPDYTVAGYLHGTGAAPVRRCSLCRSTTIYSSSLLLDPHARRLVHVQTCYKHSVSKALERWALYTLHDFVRISSAQQAKS